MHACQFWWVWLIQFRRYGYLSKTAKFPFQGMDYSPWSSENLINRNWLKKFMLVGIDVKFMHTDFGGCGFLIGSIIEESMLTAYSLLLLNLLKINNYL